MGERTKLGLGVLGAALALGGLGDLLLRPTPWGVNVLLWVLALAGGAVGLSRWGGVEAAGEGRWLVPIAVLFGALVAWRASPVVASLDVLAVLVSLSLAALRGRRGTIRGAGISEYVLGCLYAGTLFAAGPLPVATKEVCWQEVVRAEVRRPLLAVTRGLFLAVPPLVVFGALFAAADAVFEAMVLDLFGFDVSDAVGHLVVALLVSWVSAGILWVALLARNPERFAVPRAAALELGITETGMVLGLLDALFLAFVAVQVRYLFGGAGRVVETAGLTYAEYARRGFFELVVVAALVVPLLLLFHWLLRTESRARERLFRTLSGTMVALLFVIVASALQRMYLYTQEFGLTELRLYATVFMFWISVVLVWLVLTVLRGRRERFGSGVLATGFAAILLINALNPDALIARVNIDRIKAGEELDARYLTLLGADAAPPLVDALPCMSEADRQLVTRDLLARWGGVEEIDWRTWNLGRARARHLVDTRVAALPKDSHRPC